MKPEDTQACVSKETQSFTLEWNGSDLSDLIWTMDIVKKQIEEGYVQGFDSNDDGSYNYNLTAPKKER